MHALARALAVAYLVLAVFAAGVYVQVTANHVNVTDVEENLGRGIRVASVWLNWTGNAADRAIAVVNFSVHNAGKVAILIVGINYDFHMDDVSDPRPWFDSDKRSNTWIQYISLSLTRPLGIPVRAGETRIVSSSVFVLPGTEQMSRFDRPDPSQNYHPYVWRPLLFYTFVDFELPYAPVYPAPFYESQGVRPSG